MCARAVDLGWQRLSEIDFDVTDECSNAVEKLGWHGSKDVGVVVDVISECIEHRPHFILRGNARLRLHGLTVFSRSISVIGWSGDA